MRRLKKKLYLGLCAGTLAVLATVRYCHPSVREPNVQETKPAENAFSAQEAPAITKDESSVKPVPKPVSKPKGGKPQYHPIYSVYSYAQSFPDLQDVQIMAARRWGVRPVRNRQEAERRKSELVFAGACPYFDIDPNMSSSIPYLVPRASNLLQTIGRSFLDSLYLKGIPLHKIIVSSVLRTEDDVARLIRQNGNASEQSCHRFGTTFDICYNRYTTVSSPKGPRRRAVQNDTLKWVLSEVLRDMRQQGRCYIKHEVKQGCFHITVR